MRSLWLAALLCVLPSSTGIIANEQWGYVDVRPGAHVFYWAYGINSTTVARETAPWILWLQGGPGSSAVGFGNFEELGPLDQNLNPRASSWDKIANLIFLDSPVGSGYSYVDDSSLLTTNVSQIASDLLSFFKNFTLQYPEIQTAPFYIATESYGGKMTSVFANTLLAAIDAGEIKMNFRGVSLGDSWISAIDSVDTWAPYLRSMSLMDAHQKTSVVDPVVARCDAAVAAGQWAQATNYWGEVEDAIGSATDSVDWYNILVHHPPPTMSSRAMSPAAAALAPAGVDATMLAKLYQRHVGRFHSTPLGDLDSLMNGPIRAKLGIIPPTVSWGGQSDSVFAAQSGDFMTPSIDAVDALLKGGRINVTILEGQLDLICLTPGAELWMNKLTWGGMGSFFSSANVPFYPNASTRDTGAFRKQSGSLTYWTIMSAGHMLPTDAPQMMFGVIASIIGV